MTLDKHSIDGVPKITSKTLPAVDFERMLIAAGYTLIGTAPAKGDRVKSWWSHPTYRRVEAIYTPDYSTAITAYHTLPNIA